jgi:predicted dehydrogenase
MNTVRYGVIGLKRAGMGHVAAALTHDNVEIAAVADVDQPLVSQTATELGCAGFEDYRRMLETGCVDAVSIATPNHLHYPIGLDCLKAGVHIFTEKPFTTRKSEADALIKLANENGLKISVNFSYRTHRSSQLMKEYIDSGALGPIMRVLWTWAHLKPERYYTDDPWRGTIQQSGGGVLMSNASHELDLINWLIGAPKEVSAFVGNQLHDIEVEDSVCASVMFANGAYGSLQFTANQPPAYSVRQVAGQNGIIVLPNVQSLYTDQNDHLLLGKYSSSLSSMIHLFDDKPDRSAITWESLYSKQARRGGPALTRLRRLWHRYSGTRHEVNQQKQNKIFNSFIDAVLHDTDPSISGECGRQAIEFINGILLSAMRRKTVSFPIDSEEYDELYDDLVAGKVKIPFHRD